MCVFMYIYAYVRVVCVHVLYVCVFSWLLDNVTSNCMGPSIYGFFFIKYLYLVIRYWESTDAESPLSAFTAFYIGNLSTCRFLYSWRVLKPISCRYQLSFEGVGSYTQIFNYVGVSAPHPHILQGSTVYTQRTHITCWSASRNLFLKNNLAST